MNTAMIDLLKLKKQTLQADRSHYVNYCTTHDKNSVDFTIARSLWVTSFPLTTTFDLYCHPARAAASFVLWCQCTAIMGQSKNSQTFVFLHVAMEAKKGRDSRLVWVVLVGEEEEFGQCYSVQFCDLLLVFYWIISNIQLLIILIFFSLSLSLFSFFTWAEK